MTKKKRSIRNKKRKNKKFSLFMKYSKDKETLKKKEIILLMKKEFHLVYNENVLNSMINIWGENNKIPYKSFLKMFQGEDGFFRTIQL
tara:strand:+ start:225 stop:488 length:264 start_codon:yes stop_codon:yes gene_type:complete